MNDNKQLNEKNLTKVNGGANIVNPSNKTDEEYKKEELERQIRILQEIVNSGGQSYKETMELMSKIVALTRELEGLEDQTPIIRAK